LSTRAAVVDASVLYATVDLDDAHHRRCRSALTAPGLRLFVPALVVAEATYLVGTRLGPGIEAEFLAALRQLAVEAPEPEDWSRIAELVLAYRDFPLGGADASVVVLAERLGTDLILTLDRRHFAAIRPRHVPAFTLLPG
jgi:hypothetical protein